MTKQQTIEKLNSQMPSFYSLEQVIEIVAGIDCGSSIPKAETIEEVVKAAKEAIRGAVRDFDPSDCDYSLDMNGHEVYLESLDLEESTFADPVEDAIREAFGAE